MHICLIILDSLSHQAFIEALHSKILKSELSNGIRFTINQLCTASFVKTLQNIFWTTILFFHTYVNPTSYMRISEFSKLLDLFQLPLICFYLLQQRWKITNT